ncbi:Hypothetical protein A7982_01002 [Minicystis rosea]|nr:Hypothetical protein A7982_01002 [Minicystis rosea]
MHRGDLFRAVAWSLQLSLVALSPPRSCPSPAAKAILIAHVISVACLALLAGSGGITMELGRRSAARTTVETSANVR